VNHSYLNETARTAKQIGCRSISFLAADLTSEAFNRPQGWSPDEQSRIALSESQLPVLEQSIRDLIDEWGGTGFVLETPEKLQRIVLHFRAHLGLEEPVAPRCNAPWVSAVVEADGTVRPCFFHRPVGKVEHHSLFEILNGPEAIAFRSSLVVANNSICRRCVCSLNLKPSDLESRNVKAEPEALATHQ
jgi:Fe-coproporphyrin III synthase